MSYLRTFLPSIVFAVSPSGIWQWAAVAALVVAVGVIIQQLRAGTTLDALIIELGSAAYFVVLAVIAFVDPRSAVHGYSAALSSGTLAVIAGASLIIGKPFTLGIAKRGTPREWWTARPFVRANVIITAVWTAAFVTTAAILGFIVIVGGHVNSAITIGVQVASFVVPMVFTVRYAAYLRAKTARVAA